MNSISYRSIALLYLAILTGCATTRMNFDYDRDVRFGELKTFAWLAKATPETANDPITNSIVEKRFRRAISDGLSAKGYRFAEDNPDFTVTYHVSVGDDEETIYTFGDTVHPYPYRRGFYFLGGMSLNSRTIRSGYRDATIIVDVINADGKELMWRGWSAESITGASISEHTITKAVTKILKSFPPEN